jgi:hypothetical protein
MPKMALATPFVEPKRLSALELGGYYRAIFKVVSTRVAHCYAYLRCAILRAILRSLFPHDTNGVSILVYLVINRLKHCFTPLAAPISNDPEPPLFLLSFFFSLA